MDNKQRRVEVLLGLEHKQEDYNPLKMEEGQQILSIDLN